MVQPVRNGCRLFDNAATRDDFPEGYGVASIDLDHKRRLNPAPAKGGVDHAVVFPIHEASWMVEVDPPGGNPSASASFTVAQRRTRRGGRTAAVLRELLRESDRCKLARM
mmetsp:Transcript_35189/g.69357  ORF Transcript_35189/g.69357 Transcript_35189/m.69357 type:complete len:110 (-) Transcript_35189:32-361(-)